MQKMEYVSSRKRREFHIYHLLSIIIKYQVLLFLSTITKLPYKNVSRSKNVSMSRYD